MVRKNQKSSLHHRKRHGRHQKHTPHFLKVYAPYLPLLCALGILILSSGSWLGLKPKNHSVLAYATDATINALLTSTNRQRAQNGRASLNLNAKLSQAAQAKANDMTARNYWSHNTPEGNPPWTFYDQAGYTYQKAGENLAYGFATSSDTITGWMNSPPHRENLLDSTFVEVGFGIARSLNYQGKGPATVVVAEYGTPRVQAVETTTTAEAPSIAPTSALVTSAMPNVNTSVLKATTEPNQSKISRAQSLTLGSAPWSNFVLGLIMGSAGIWFVVKYGLSLRRLVLNGEHFILHHPLLDSTLVSLVVIGVVLSQTAGIIR